MTQTLAFLIVVTAMMAPYVLAAALAAAFPSLQRGFGRASSTITNGALDGADGRGRRPVREG